MAVVFLLSVDFCGAVSLSESAARAAVSHGAAGVNVTAARSVNAPQAVTTTLSVSDAEKLHNRYGTAVGGVTSVIAAAALDVILGFMRFFESVFHEHQSEVFAKYFLRLKGENMTASLWVPAENCWYSCIKLQERISCCFAACTEIFNVRVFVGALSRALLSGA
jgi:hypothetical protein